MSKLSQSLEDYLEALYLLAQDKQTVRVKDLVNKMGVRSPSVIGALNRLRTLNLVQHEHHSHVALTSSGEQEAKRVYRRHLILTTFLSEILQVPPLIAESDACKIEHLISSETLQKLSEFLKTQGIDDPFSG